MPIVFVHGVSTRKVADYEAHRPPRKREDTHDYQMLRITERLRAHTLPALPAPYRALPILDAYWGDLGATFPLGMAALPHDPAEQFGPDDRSPLMLDTLAASNLSSPDTVLLTVARRSLDGLIDLLWEAADAHADQSAPSDAAAAASARADLDALARDALDCVSPYTREDGSLDHPPAWLEQVHDDAGLIERFAREVEKSAGRKAAAETFGPGHVLAAAWGTVRDGMEHTWNWAANVTGEQIAEIRQRRWGEGMAYFFGDVAAFLRNREPIVTRVGDMLEQASPRADGDEPLIVVAHSMGGNIVYEILAHQRPHLRCKALVTVGSQVGLFEELRLFGPMLPLAAGSTAPVMTPKPGNVGKWLNVYDTSDVLGYAAARVFTGAKDFEFRTGRIAHWSHSGYFKGRSFYRRLGERLGKLLA